MAGRTFQLLYGGSFAVLLLVTTLVWRRCQPAFDPSIEERGLDAVELAALTGGGRRAAVAAMVALRRGHVRTGPGGTMLADGPLADDAGELERELFEAVRASPSAPASSLVDSAAGGAAASAILARLQAAGLLLNTRATAWMRVLWACAAALTAAGLLALVDRWDGDAVVATLVSPLGGVAACSAALWWWIHQHRSGASAAGRRLVNGIGDAGEGVRGRTAGAVDVALFGTAVLWTHDWPLAQALGVPEHEDEQAPIASLIGSWISDGDGCGWGCGCG